MDDSSLCTFYFYQKYISRNSPKNYLFLLFMRWKQKQNKNIFEQNVWYSCDSSWLLWKFSTILANFLLPGSVLWNGSGSSWLKLNGSGSATLFHCWTNFLGPVYVYFFMVQYNRVVYYVNMAPTSFQEDSKNVELHGHWKLF